MTNRENVLRALRRNQPEKVPFDFKLCDSKVEEFKKMTGMEDYHEYYNLPVREISMNKTKKFTDFSKYYDNLPEDAEPLPSNPEWGIMSVKGSIAHFRKMIHPMQNFETVDEINEYPTPDFNAEYRWEGLSDRVKELIEKDLIVAANMEMTIFELSWYLRGIDNFMVDLMTDEEFACALLDKVTEVRVGMSAKYAKAGVDILRLGDDVATQLDMMISPELWRKFLKPRLAKVIRAAKEVNPELLVFYHGDGNMQKIIPDMIEIGVDILNPVQPECMDPIEIKRLYGDKLSFWGTLGTQTTIPFGTPEEVKETCKNLIENVGKDGGLLLAPTHLIEPEVPFENIQAFLDAIKAYAKY